LKYRCEIASRYLLPAFRSLIARELIEKHSFTQSKVAEKLGTTQASISQYLSSKRGEKYIKQLKNDPKIKSTIRELVDGLVDEKISSDEIMNQFCEICVSFTNN
jgi:hypothetical protein